jgi:putative sigma-54 modulation protein
MKINISSIHFKADQKLEDFVQEKVERLSAIYDGVIGSEVTLKIDKNKVTENKVAEIKLIIRGNDLFAKKQCKSFEEATDSAVEALRKQLKKYKEKIKGL